MFTSILWHLQRQLSHYSIEGLLLKLANDKYMDDWKHNRLTPEIPTFQRLIRRTKAKAPKALKATKRPYPSSTPRHRRKTIATSNVKN